VFYDFSYIIGRVIALSRKNFREYVKTDSKYLVFSFLGFSLVIFAFFNLFLVYSGIGFDDILLIVLISLIGVILILYSMYLNVWLINSKAVFVFQLYSSPKNEDSYETTLQKTSTQRNRVFFGTLISGFLIGSIIAIIYVVLIIGVFIGIGSGSSNFPAIFLVLIIIFFILLMITIYFSIPLQIYPAILMIENELGYINGIKRSYSILSGWLTRIKFLFLFGILTYIVNFAMEFVFFGLLIGTIVIFLLITTLFNLSGSIVVFLGIITLSLVTGFFFTLAVEIQGVVAGNLYGQTYVSLVYPDLNVNLDNKSNNENLSNNSGSFCTNCGDYIKKGLNSCANCGKPI
jgi:hypothetical protein